MKSARSSEISETWDLQNISYVLEDNRIFQLTDYKVMKGLEGNGLLRCAHLLYNGKIKLLYFTEGRAALKALLPAMDGDTFLTVLASLLRAVLEVEGNGFLSCGNLELEADRIFVDTATWAVNLIYLPVRADQKDLSLFERDLRSGLSQMISSCHTLRTEKVETVYSALSDNSLSLEGLYRRICRMCQSEAAGKALGKGAPKQPLMEIYSVDPDKPAVIRVTKPEFTLGKNPAIVDGAVPYNPAVSRRHCRILWRNGIYYLEDLGSANGTYVNKAPISPNQRWEIKDGDEIRLANSSFTVRIRKDDL